MARETLIADGKLDLILKIKSTTVDPVRVGDLVQFLIKQLDDKREKCSSVKSVLFYDKQSSIEAVSGQNGLTIKAAVEDVRFAITDNELAWKYQEANDIVDTALDESIDSFYKHASNKTDD